jgi:transposase-like protein
MRYPACEKLEIIQLVEHSHLPARRTLVKLGIPRATFYRWYDLYRTGGPDALGDRSPRPDRVWNQIPDMVRQRIIRLALDEPALSPRELAEEDRRRSCAGRTDGSGPRGADSRQALAGSEARSSVSCGQCSFVCPHAVIRAKYNHADKLDGAPATYKSAAINVRGFQDVRFSLQF